MSKLESLDASLFQMIDDEESVSLVGGNMEPDKCRATAAPTYDMYGPDAQADVKCTF